MTRRLLYRVTAQRFREAIRPSLVGSLRDVDRAIAQRAGDVLAQWLRAVIREALAKSRINDDNGNIHRQLLDGMRVYGRASLSDLRGDLYGDPWIAAHEYGATIRPKGRYLTIPVYYALRPDGRPKFRNASSWRRFGSFIYTAKSGNKFIAYKSASGELRLLYLLLDEATIPPRLRLRITAGRNYEELMIAWGNIYIQECKRAGREPIPNPWKGMLNG
jgi:hypothetical protein